ncbi:MAG: hypothetical protein AAGG72_00520 [Pseudomonadota bacterium]
MFFYFLQIALLMLAAYLIGAIVGCFLHRLIAGGSTVTPDIAQPAGAAGLTGAGLATAGGAAVAASEPVIETRTRSAPNQPLESTPDRFEKVITEAPVDFPDRPDGVAPPADKLVGEPDANPIQSVAAVTTAAAAATAAAVTSRQDKIDQPTAELVAATTPSSIAASGPTTEPTTLTAPMVGMIPPAIGPADDLKAIRHITPAIERKLNSVGVTQFAQLAALSPAGVEEVSSRTGEGRGLNADNWIEQAAMLSTGQQTRYAADRASGQERQSQWDLPAAIPAMVAAGGVAAGVGVPAAEAFANVEVAGPAAETNEPSDPNAPDIADEALDHERDRQSVAPALGAVTAGDIIEGAAARDDDTPADDFRRIEGIDADAANKLNHLGFIRYRDLASLSASDVTELEAQLETPGRVSRENWIEQAQVLASGRQTDFARRYDNGELTVPEGVENQGVDVATPFAAREETEIADGPAPKSEPVEPMTAAPIPQQPALPPAENVSTPTPSAELATASADDLKRIRGVGMLIEKKLNSLGITSYQQIANWTNSDIDRLSQALDFKGRIERENWVEQARILSSGGNTEFSKRVDRPDRRI